MANTAWKQGLPKSIKFRFIKRLKGSSIDSLAFLRDIDPGNFLYLLRYSNEQLTDDDLMECYNRIPESYKPFAIWNLGRIGKWELIKPFIESYINDPFNEFKGFSSVIFDH